jgi:lipopolysaccharide transport system ATP-binding protein
MNNVIEIENLSKIYDLGMVGTGTLSKDLNRLWAKLLGRPDPYSLITESNDRTIISKSNTVYALKDINFNVSKGEILGIIGDNGAGKSTLLKILSQITSPSSGIVKMKGRVASLLEVGTGMHPEMTARQNIFMNGSIMGMSYNEITHKLSDIIEFAGIEKYIETPIKRFSSGMKVRLGFAVAAFLEPEILIIDEVLAVGDAEFQKKAIGKIQDISKGNGRTVLFVSHNMAAVQKLCSKALILNKGKIQFSANPKECVEHYLRNNVNYNNEILFKQDINSYGIKLNFVKINYLKDNEVINVESGFEIEVEFENYNLRKTITCGIVLINKDLIRLFEIPCFLFTEKNSKKGVFNIKATIPPYLLNAGNYNFNFVVAESQKHVLFKKENIVSVKVEDTNFNKGHNLNIPQGVLRPKIFANATLQKEII